MPEIQRFSSPARNTAIQQLQLRSAGGGGSGGGGGGGRGGGSSGGTVDMKYHKPHLAGGELLRTV